MIGLMGAAISIAAGTLSSLLTLGTFGALRDRGWGPWKAGAATGAISGGIGAIGWLIFSKTMGDKLRLPGTDTETAGIFTERVSGMPISVTGLTMSRLSGLPIKVNGVGASLEDLQLGAYGVDPVTMQLQS